MTSSQGGAPLLPAHRNALRDLPAADRTVPRLLQRQAERYGDKPLVVCGATTWSYREVVERAARMAGALRRRGIEPGDRIAILCGNRLELLETVLGCAWSGVIAVPLNTALRGAGLRHPLADSGARVIVIEPELSGVLDGIDLPAGLRERWIVDVLSELPLTENGKVRKAALRERGVTAATWDRASPGPGP